ncbi:unnamed protein product [Rangifer tarandus platyrhynchus]|uniref:Uncharacterized protein n=2 Tax=Rangifer tarandus platyrhynchus TaxID=3082113 RepID=A0AC60A6H5_RANTA|nr:unnamed protein product [Rangifer tarandus platyrhynchus]
MPLTLDKGGNKLRRAPRAGGPTGQRVPVNTTHGSRLIAVLHLQSVASTQRPCPTAPGFLLRCGRARENSAADQSLSRESERSLLERPVKSRWEGPENKRRISCIAGVSHKEAGTTAKVKMDQHDEPHTLGRSQQVLRQL